MAGKMAGKMAGSKNNKLSDPRRCWEVANNQLTLLHNSYPNLYLKISTLLQYILAKVLKKGS